VQGEKGVPGKNAGPGEVRDCCLTKAERFLCRWGKRQEKFGRAKGGDVRTGRFSKGVGKKKSGPAITFCGEKGPSVDAKHKERG